jgi:hypothetical protein
MAKEKKAKKSKELSPEGKQTSDLLEVVNEAQTTLELDEGDRLKAVIKAAKRDIIDAEALLETAQAEYKRAKKELKTHLKSEKKGKKQK